MHLSEFFGYIETGHIQAVAEAIRVDSNASMVNARDEDGVTPLQWAAEHGQIEIARLLLSLGADVQARNDERQHFAAVFKDLNLARLLLEAGADIQTQNALGHTPLHELAWYGQHHRISIRD